MATLTHLDTHVVIWVSAGQHHHMSARGTAALDDDDLRISPMVRLELGYLHELGRLADPPGDVIGDLQRWFRAREDALPFGAVVDEAMAMTWTRDPFDRVIAAQAIAAGARLLTRDETILENVALAFW